MLRNVLKCTLPIELYHFPDEFQDPALREELVASYDLRLMEVGGKRPNGKSWSTCLLRKAIAHLWLILQTSRTLLSSLPSLPSSFTWTATISLLRIRKNCLMGLNTSRVEVFSGQISTRIIVSNPAIPGGQRTALDLLLMIPADNAIFRVLGRHCTDLHWPAEAGQIIFNKAANNGLNLAVLHLANHMMDNEDMYGFLSYGDKDTFVRLRIPSNINTRSS